MARPNPTYDIELDGQGYMLERGKSGRLSKRAWSVTPRYASLAQQSPLAGRYNPQHPLVEAMEVWPDLAGGYGDDDQQLPGRYRYSENVDCRFRGQILPGPKVTPVTVATATANVNCWAELNGRLFFAGGRYVYEVDTTDGSVAQRKDLGSGNAVVDMAAFGGQLYVSLGLADPFWVLTPGATYATDAWACYLPTASYAFDHDGATTLTTWADNDSGTVNASLYGTWRGAECAMWIEVESGGTTIKISFDDKATWPITGMTILTDWALIADELYLKLPNATETVGRDWSLNLHLQDYAAREALTVGGGFSARTAKVYRIEITQVDAAPAVEQFRWSDDDGATWTTGVAVDADAPITLNHGLTVQFGSETLHEMGPGYKDTWTFTAYPMGVTYWAVVRNLLWAATDTAVIQGLAEGANGLIPANWGASYSIGDSQLAITAMAAQGDFLFIGKTNGVHVVDSSYQGVAVTPELQSAVHADNCKNMAQWHGLWYVPHIRGLLTYAASEYGHQIGSATPHAVAGKDNPARGQVLALAGDDQWLYALVYSSDGHSWLLAGREAAESERPYVGAMVWHTLAKIASAKCQSLHLTGLFTNPRLYMGQGTNIGYVVLPRQAANPLQDSNSRYALTGSVYLPAHDLYAPATPKIWRAVAIEADELTLARYVEVYYRLNKSGHWGYVGRANVAPRHLLALPAHGVAGYTIELRLDYVIPLDSTPIKIRRVTLYGAERPEALDQLAVVIRCGDRLPTRSGGTCPRNAEQIRAELKALGQATRSVQLVDTVGQEWQVLVQAGIKEEEAEQEGGQPREVLLTVYLTPFETEATPTATGTPFVVGTSLVGGPHILM